MKKNWWNSLQVKIIAWSFVPTVIILSAVAWFTFYSYQKVLGDLAIKQDQEIVQSKMERITEAFNNLVVPVILPIYYLDTNPELNLEAHAQNILDQIQGLEIFDGGIYFLDQQGKVIKTQPAQLELIGQDWSGTPWFRFIQEHPNVAGLSDLLTIGSTGKKVVCSAVAMTNQKVDFIGAGYFCYLIYPATQNAYYQTLNSVDLDPKVYVLDRNLEIVFSPDPSQMGQDMSGETYLQQILQSESRSKRFQNGSFAIVGHPIYVGFIFAAIGSLLIYQTWATLLFAYFTPALFFRACHEEVALAVEFGDEWEEYCKCVPAFFPRFGKG